MTESGIIEKTKAIMNEAGSDSGFNLLSEDTLKIEEYISKVIPDAFLQLSKIIPVRYLPEGIYSGSSTIDNEDGCTRLTIPDDFSMFIAIRLSGWKREVQLVFPLNSDEYKRQHNSITRSGVNKPSCVYSGRDTIECFPKGSLSYFKYAKTLNISTAHSDLEEPICYMCASLVYDIFENTTTSERMKTIAESLIPKQ